MAVMIHAAMTKTLNAKETERERQVKIKVREGAERDTAMRNQLIIMHLVQV